MKNTLQFKKEYDFNNSTTIYSNENVLVYRHHDNVCDIDILHIKVNNAEKKGLKITKTAKCIMIFPVNEETLFIVGLDDCKSMTVKGNGKVTMTVEL